MLGFNEFSQKNGFQNYRDELETALLIIDCIEESLGNVGIQI